jgi:hypothetical protein
MRRSPGDPHALLSHYETLRREALATLPLGPRGHGLALFLTRGMSAWLAAVTALAPSVTPPTITAEVEAGCPRTTLPPGRSEFTTVLAGMVLACAAAGAEGRS